MNKKTVILVDDDLTNLTMGSEFLAESYNAVTLNSGVLLLKMLNSALKAGRPLPDLVLLDIDMPDMDGYEIINQLKQTKDFKDIPVIFVTAKSGSENELKGLSLGAVDYVCKPFFIPLLLKRINLHLHRIEQKLELIKSNICLQKTVDEQSKELRTLRQQTAF